MRYKQHFKYSSDILSLVYNGAQVRCDMAEKEDGYTFSDGAVSCETRFIEHESGVIRRCDTLKNISDKTIDISSALSKFIFNGGEYRVYTEYSEWCAEGQGKWQDLVTEVSASNDDIRMNVGSTPFFAFYNMQTGRGAAFHILAESTWSFRIKKHYSQTDHTKQLHIELGIRERGFSYELKPGEELRLPEILFYEFRNQTDMDAYKLHRYYNSTNPARCLPIIYNSWMSRFDNISFDILSEQLEVAKSIGCEYFVIDAGWFGKPNEWADLVGDWEECEEYSMQGRMKDFADKVRAYGLKFGIWFEIERAAAASKTVSQYPEHYFKEGNHYFVDFASESAVEYIFDKISKQIRKYGVEFIKFDFNAEVSIDTRGVSFIEYFKGYNGFINRLREEFPELYLQNCASGGLRMALGAMRGFDSFWMSDNHSLYTQLEIFKSSLLRIPSRSLEKWITIRSLEGFSPRYGGGVSEKILSSGDAAWGHLEAVNMSFIKAVAVGGPIGFTCDLTKLSSETVSELRDMVTRYKEEREFWISSECRILCNTDSLLVLQFSDSELNELKIYHFVKVPHQNQVTVYPVCDINKTYVLNGREITGKQLDSCGVNAYILDRFTAGEIILSSK